MKYKKCTTKPKLIFTSLVTLSSQVQEPDFTRQKAHTLLDYHVKEEFINEVMKPSLAYMDHSFTV